MDACQVTLVSLDELVCVKHPYRKFAKLFDFKVIEPVLKTLDGLSNCNGFLGDLCGRSSVRLPYRNFARNWLRG